MAEEQPSGQERNEQPTPQRRARAREQGRIARSVELAAAAGLLGGALLLTQFAANGFAVFTHRVLRESAGAMSFAERGPEGTAGMLQLVMRGALVAFLPFAMGLTAIILAVNLAQARGVISWRPVLPNFDHVNPISGCKRLFSREALFTGFKSLFKLAAIALASYWIITRAIPQLVSLPQTGPAEIALVMQRLAVRMAVLLGVGYLVLAAIDYAYQHFRLEQSLRMTRQEVMYDLRDSEGDPHVKARLLSMAHAHARRRMLQRVPTADVVVVNPTEIAVALKYDLAAASAPLVLAMGQRKLAARIREIAERAGVPIVENRPVARALLATSEVGRPIPPALYAAVAEILAFIYRQRDSLRGLPEVLRPRKIA